MQQSYAYRTTMAPLQQSQQEGLKAWGRLARFQCTIAGDLLEHNLAGMQAMMSAATPTEYLARQGQLNARFVEKVATHTCEFLREAAAHSTSAEEETVRVAEAAVQAEQLEEAIHADDPPLESIEAQRAARAKPTTAGQRKKRSDKSRRGQAHH